MNIKDIIERLKKKTRPSDEEAPASDSAENAVEEISEATAEAADDSAENDGEDAVENDDGASAEDGEKNIFAKSLTELTADDVAPLEVKKRTAGEIARLLIRPAVMIVCAAVFVCSAATLVYRLFSYERADDIYSDIADSIFEGNLGGERAVSLMSAAAKSTPLPDYYTSLKQTGEENPTDTQVSYDPRYEQVKANLSYLKSVNPDIFGYIFVEGTNINFPIVQGTDNEYYLNRAWNGEYLVVGSIYADYQASRNMDDNRNTVFYGHNMLDGNMFNNVMLFFDEEVFNSKKIVIYTFDGVYTYEPFSIFQTVYTYQYFRMNFASDGDFVAFCEEMQSQSNFNKNMTFDADDHVITLSTCTPSNDTSSYYVGRIALHAKLVEVQR